MHPGFIVCSALTISESPFICRFTCIQTPTNVCANNNNNNNHVGKRRLCCYSNSSRRPSNEEVMTELVKPQHNGNIKARLQPKPIWTCNQEVLKENMLVCMFWLIGCVIPAETWLWGSDAARKQACCAWQGLGPWRKVWGKEEGLLLMGIVIGWHGGKRGNGDEYGGEAKSAVASGPFQFRKKEVKTFLFKGPKSMSP